VFHWLYYETKSTEKRKKPTAQIEGARKGSSRGWGGVGPQNEHDENWKNTSRGGDV